MKCKPLVAAAWLGAGLALAGCGSRPKPAAKPPLPLALHPDCAWVTGPGGESKMACLLADELPDTQWDASHPGSVACSSDSFSVFKQTVSMPLRLGFGQKDEDRLSQVRVSGTLGPGTHTGKVGKSAGNGCDATLGPVSVISTRFGGSYTAQVDKSQSLVCVRQSRLVLSTFEQALPAFLPAGTAQVARDITSDALQKRLDLEVAIRANAYWRPAASGMPRLLAGNGRCADGFRSDSGR